VTGGFRPFQYVDGIVDGGIRQTPVKSEDLSFVDVCEEAGRKSGLFVSMENIACNFAATG
jgi:hypothetical protein